jgi:hypothetical protein
MKTLAAIVMVGVTNSNHPYWGSRRNGSRDGNGNGVNNNNDKDDDGGNGDSDDGGIPAQ